MAEYNFEDDLKALAEEPLLAKRSKGNGWALLFEQKEYWRNLADRDLVAATIDQKAKDKYIKKVCANRKLFINRAQWALREFHREAQLDQADVLQLAKKIQNRGSGKKRNPYEIHPSEYIEPTAIDSRKKGGRRGKLSLDQWIDIVFQVIIAHAPTREVAKKHKITESYVTKMCSKARKKPEFLRELLEKKDQERTFEERAARVIELQMTENKVFTSVKQMQERINDAIGLEVRAPQLMKIIHRDLGLKYKRIVATSWQGNSVKNLLMRQKFAEEFLKLDLSKKMIINIDETWLGMGDMRRMKWCLPGRSNTVPKKQIQPRISVVAALDSNGEVYITLLQVNSNSEMMVMYLSHLIQLLDGRRRGCRSDTVLMMDNAPYHTSSLMMEFYEKQKLPIIFTGPHSYSASPIELFFAHFKRTDINPSQLPTGKQ